MFGITILMFRSPSRVARLGESRVKKVFLGGGGGRGLAFRGRGVARLSARAPEGDCL